jgi:hypothetical protein
MTGVFVDGIYVAIYIAAPWILWAIKMDDLEVPPRLGNRQMLDFLAGVCFVGRGILSSSSSWISRAIFFPPTVAVWKFMEHDCFVRWKMMDNDG